MHILTAPENLAFVIALAVVMALAVLQLLSLLLGGAGFEMGGDGHDAIHLGDGLHSHAALDAHGVDHDGLDFDGSHDGVFHQMLAWLHVGQMPFTILLILFLLNFGIAGLVLQNLVKSAAGVYMAAPLAVGAALLVALPGLRLSGGLLRPLLPREETEAVSHDSFIGRGAQITAGTARYGRPAEARLRDNFGRTHYVMVEPENEEDIFVAGSHVLLLKRDGALYRAMGNTSAALDD
jgi:hypothetical protein